MELDGIAVKVGTEPLLPRARLEVYADEIDAALARSGVRIDVGQRFEGPEDATLGPDSAVYATTLSGHVIRIRNRRAEQFADVGGRPLGIETDRVADQAGQA